MSELTARRWEKGSGKPAEHPVAEALEVAAHRIRTGEWPATHVIVVVGYVNEDRAAETSFTQAGPLDAYGQIGLMHTAIGMLNEAG